MASLHIVVAEYTCAPWDWACPRFFFHRERAHHGDSNAETCDTFFLLKALWESKEELRVHSSKPCLIQILRLVSKSRRSWYVGKVSSDFLSELGNSFIFKFKFLLIYCQFAPAYSWSYTCRLYSWHSQWERHTCLPLNHFVSISHSSHVLHFLFATMVCISLYDCVDSLDRTHICLVQRARRNCAGLGEGSGW